MAQSIGPSNDPLPVQQDNLILRYSSGGMNNAVVVAPLTEQIGLGASQTALNVRKPQLHDYENCRLTETPAIQHTGIHQTSRRSHGDLHHIRQHCLYQLRSERQQLQPHAIIRRSAGSSNRATGHFTL
jgi:hypothetical protein